MVKVAPSVRIAQIQSFAGVTRALPHHLCSHLQNVTRRRVGVTSVAYNAMNLGICNVLLRHGFISSMTRGPPLSRSTDAPAPEKFDEKNATTQALHITPKYRGAFPVLNRARLVSRPRLHLYASHSELHNFLHGRRFKQHRSLGAGEVVVVRTPEGRYLEGWEALAEGTGGEVLAAFG